MKRIAPQPLTAAAFAPFGEVIEVDAGAQPLVINRGQTLRFHDLAAIDVEAGGGRPALSVFRGEPLDPCVLAIFERHPLGSQAFVPLDGNPYLVAVAPAGAFDPAAVRIFRATGRQGVNYRRNVWHHFLLPLTSGAHFLVIDREGPGVNLDEHELPLADRIAIDG
ncbi:ureidoglycolate lyase [Sphingomonas sp. CL5.1]|uniref:ureidoglycolate lyase n=1 Tax=Sphingomonas sp. CL5.1 TaxID=2653203 RepID=UPI0015814A1D|nr:ureidoglycolate lyase [Sphingomonas sp. CL5.1]QKS00443.1 ureidoglycolate lyase [Sphingomonas sp. CL5.1]